ncbi:MAG: hypothetical protein U1C71_01480, partial [archaeon]|nr:hypothetical protein [archaeon]
MTQNKLWSNWKVLLWMAFVLISLFLIIRIDTSDGFSLTHNLKLGSEFSGGTLFQLQLAHPATADEMQDIRLIVEKRLNPTGIRDVTVSSTGQSIVLAQVAETQPEEVEKQQALLLRQGRFESFLNGKLIFDGSQIVQVIESAQQGFGAQPIGVGNQYQWTLPFLLNDKAANDFARAAFHQCTQSGFSAGQPQYDCAFTYFFIDRPADAVIIYPQDVRAADNAKVFTSTQVQLPEDISISQILDNADLHVIMIDANAAELDANQMAFLQSLPSSVQTAILPPGVS